MTTTIAVSQKLSTVLRALDPFAEPVRPGRVDRPSLAEVVSNAQFIRCHVDDADFWRYEGLVKVGKEELTLCGRIAQRRVLAVSGLTR